MTTPAELLEGTHADLLHLESVWQDGLRDAYAHYRARAEHRVALAAALVEAATGLQRLGRGAAGPRELLLGDLCLARASRLLAETGSRILQVGFARAVERVAAAAAGGPAAPPLRAQLEGLLGAGS